MKFTLNAINAQVIESYKEFLRQRLDKAVMLPFKKVMVNGQAPKANNCHENSQIYESENSNYDCIRGWLVVDGGNLNSEVILLAHSVVRDTVNMDTYEITPIYSLEPRPFLESYLTEEEYFTLYQYLAQKTYDVKLIINKFK